MLSQPSENTAGPIRVLIVDDHTVVRYGLRLMLEQKPGFEVVGEAADGLAAIHQSELLKPDVILMDLAMKGLDGVAAITQIHQTCPEIRILVLTSFPDDAKIMAAIQAGAMGYLLKDTSPSELVAAIQRVHRGEVSLSPDLARRLVLQLHGSQKPSQPETPLTDREIEVLRLAASGLSNPEIAKKLFITEGTVRFHFSNILDKLHLPNRTQAILYALRQGWADLK
jgi:NarL family two-component system response regulator LiaR